MHVQYGYGHHALTVAGVDNEIGEMHARLGHVYSADIMHKELRCSTGKVSLSR